MLVKKHFLINRAILLGFLLSLIGIFAAASGRAIAEVSRTESETARYQSNLGAYFWQKGNLSQALAAWKKEAEIYHDQGLISEEAKVIVKIAQTYTSLGQLQLAIFHLNQVLSLTQEPSLLASAWNQLGNAYSRDGLLDRALSAYNKSLKIERSLSTLNNLVGLQQKQGLYAQLKANGSREGAEAQHYWAEASKYEEEARKSAESALFLSQIEKSTASVQALLEWGKISPTGLSVEELERGRNILTDLPASRTKVFLLINWAKLDSDRAGNWLSKSTEVAETIGDATAKSYAWLEMSLLAEKKGQLAKALDYAQSAISYAWSESVTDVLYRSYWLAGRIARHYKEREATLKNYRHAIDAFENLNQGVTKINVGQRLNFSSQVEPMYRTVLELLLENPSESNLQESLLILAKLRLAQLQNYFGDICVEFGVENPNSQAEKVTKNSVRLFSIILDDQTHFILQLEDGTLRHSRASIGKAGITKLATDWYSSLTIDSEDFLERSYSWQFWQQGQDLYALIIRPFEKQLEQIATNLIIFVHDGILRNLPMAALTDGEKFLAQKWASVSSLGLNFKSTAIPEQETTAVAFGLGVAREGWSELSEVEQEIENVIKITGGKSFLDEEFTSNNLAHELNQGRYSLVHLATHGYFGGIAENSLILAYDQPLNVLELEDVLAQSQSPIQFLVFSACETALSSDFSTLGMAGVALRNGVDSVLGSYWAVQDNEQTELIQDFYTNFSQNNLDKPQALQQIQIEQIERDAHPSKWAAFNLIEVN